MIKKRMKAVLSAGLCLLLVSALSAPAWAWVPSYIFYCFVEAEGIPEGAVYAELLLPFDSEDECYVQFNSKNGEKYGVGDDSEIALYEEDGYRSYTFHTESAVSDMELMYDFDLYFTPEQYELSREELPKHGEPNAHDMGGNGIYVTIRIPRSDTDGVAFVQELCLADERSKCGGIRVTFCDFYDKDAKYNFSYFCRNFCEARLAYLSAEGEVISVSNSAPIYDKKLRSTSYNLGLYLDGTTLDSEISKSPQNWGGLIVGMLAAFVLLPVALVLGIFFVTDIFERKRKCGQGKGR